MLQVPNSLILKLFQTFHQIATNAKARLEELQYATMIEEEKFEKLNVVLGQIRDIHIDTEEHNLFYDIIHGISFSRVFLNYVSLLLCVVLN